MIRGFWYWLMVLLLSGAASLAVVRLTIPSCVDDRLTAIVLFYILPIPVILLLGRIHRLVGVAAAIVLPFIWLVLAMAADDTLRLWLAPLLAALVLLWADGKTRTSSGARRGGWSALVLAVVVLAWPNPSPPANGTRLLLLGVDGATWTRLDPLLAAGRLPNFARLLEDGHRARLRTLPSMYSPRVWSTLATGCLPDQHGIYCFSNHQSDFKVGRIWDRLRADHRTFGTCGWYFTWPPLDGLGEHDFVVPSMLAPDDACHPSECGFFWQLWNGARAGPDRTADTSPAAAGLQAFRFGVSLSTLRQAVFERVGSRFPGRNETDMGWRNRRLSARLQGDIFAELLRTRGSEFAAVLFNQVDAVSHRYWKYMQPEFFPEVTTEDSARYGEAIHATYEVIDHALGRILDNCPDDVDVILVSDHGFRPALRKVADRNMRIRTEHLVAILGLEGEIFGTNVDRKVYLHPTVGSDAERQALLDEIAGTLVEIHLVGETEPVFDVEMSDLTLCVRIASRPSLPDDARLQIGDAVHDFEDVINASQEWHFSGEHHPDGVYILSGPAAVRASGVDSLNVIDVAPTVAALLGLPVSLFWSGRPALTDFTLTDQGLAEYPLPMSDVSNADIEVTEELKRKLRALGYLD